MVKVVQAIHALETHNETGLLKSTQLIDVKATLAMRCLSDLACNTDSNTSLARSLALKTSERAPSPSC